MNFELPPIVCGSCQADITNVIRNRLDTYVSSSIEGNLFTVGKPTGANTQVLHDCRKVSK